MSLVLSKPFVFTFCQRMLALSLLCFFTACATRPTTLDPVQATSIQRVGVISLLPNNLPVKKIGITVFNNEYKDLPVGNRFNDAARKGVESALRASNKEVIQIHVPTEELAKKIRSAAIIFDSRAEQIKDELLVIIRQNNLNAVVLILEDFDAENGVHGIWVHLRAGIGDVRSAVGKPDFSTLLVGQDTKYMATASDSRGGWFGVNRVQGTWTYNLEENLDTLTINELVSSFSTRIEQRAASHIRQIGF